MARVMSPVGLGPEDPVQVDFFLLSVLVSALVLISFPLLFFDGLDEKNRARASTPLGSVPPELSLFITDVLLLLVPFASVEPLSLE